MEAIYYKRNGLKRPSFNRLQRAIISLNRLSFVRNVSIIKRLILRTYGLSEDTSINKTFFCSSKNVKIGKNVGLNDTFILAYSLVKIGDNCSFSFRNMIITSTHDLNDFSTIIAKPVTIGDNVWITTNVTILPGVRIGDNSVIGAGSVVTKDIPSNVFATGNPCRVVKHITFNK